MGATEVTTLQFSELEKFGVAAFVALFACSLAFRLRLVPLVWLPLNTQDYLRFDSARRIYGKWHGSKCTTTKKIADDVIILLE